MLVWFVFYPTRGCGRIARPAFPAPSDIGGRDARAKNSDASRRGNADARWSCCRCSFLVAAHPSRRGLPAAPQDEVVIFAPKSDPHGEEAHRAVSNHEAT